MNTTSAYAKYVEANFGDLTEDEFGRYYPRASAFVSSITMGRSETVPDTDEDLIERVMFAKFSVTQELSVSFQNDGSGPVISESNDGISVTYASSKDSRTTEQRMRDSAALYLHGTGLLYRGVCFRC